MNSLEQVDWSKIPPPTDDGACDHLTGTSLPSTPLTATDGSTVDVSKLTGRSVIYAYPMTGRPDVPLPDGWDMIPGARGCTPQSCAFRDHMTELTSLGVDHLFGLSTQDNQYQIEAAARLHLPYLLLSDADLQFTGALQLPTMRVGDNTLLKRLTLIVEEGVINKVFYPVFPPDKNVSDVINHLSTLT